MLIKTYYEDVLQFKAARTILNRPIYYSHFFFVDGLLIDSGLPHISSEIITALRVLPVKKVAITHQHEDHAGNCSLIQKELGIPVYAHPDTKSIIANPPAIQIYRKIMWGKMPRTEASPLKNILDTENYRFQVIHTPGHSADHVSFFEPKKKWLFCGDLYIGENLTSFMAGENIVEHLTSLQKLIFLKPKILFCGLKGRLEDAEERLIRKYNNWWSIGRMVRKLFMAGLSRKQILAEIFGGEDLFYYFSQSNWGRRFMLESIIENISYFETETKNESFPGPVHYR